MNDIVRGTTPTIMFKFKTVSVADISVAYLDIDMNGQRLLEKDLSSATVGEDSLSWTLSQEETLSMTKRSISIMLNWKLNDGITRGASEEAEYRILPNKKEEVI